MNRILLAFIILLPIACGKRDRLENTPAGILPMDSMALFLRDIHDLESALLVSGIRQDSLQNLYRELEPGIFQKHHSDTAKVNRSLRYYTSDPELLDSLYHRVLHFTDSTAEYKP